MGSVTTAAVVAEAATDRTVVTSICAELAAPPTATGRHRVPSDLADEQCGRMGESLLGDSNRTVCSDRSNVYQIPQK